MNAHHSTAYKQLQEDAQAIEARWLVPTGRILIVCIQHAGGDAHGLHVSCFTLAGEEALAIDLPMDATLSELESTIKDSFQWAALDFVSKDVKDNIFASCSGPGPRIRWQRARCLANIIAPCWSVNGEAPESDTTLDTSLCRSYKALTVKEVASPKGIDHNYRNGRIDTRTCHRCGCNDVKVNEFTEWCKMNGDAGGSMISVCMTCGLYLTESWDDE